MYSIDYSKLDDREIDKIISEKRLGLSSDKDIQRLFNMGKLNFCSNPSDAWPIILDTGIELSPMFRGEWCASYVDHYTYDEAPIYSAQSVHENPLRAAMIVYLNVLAQEKDVK